MFSRAVLRRATGFGGVVAFGGAALASERERVSCHCMVPCGIFDDPVRAALLKEDAKTIRKAMTQVVALAPESAALSLNQAVRWVNVKEQSAYNIITMVSEYMLCQRVKKELFKNEEEYHLALELHHALLQAAMKAKQTTDTKAC